MKKLLALSLTALICIGLLAGCGSADSHVQQGRSIVDGAGRRVEVPEKPEAIVCIGVGALRYSCYMGAADLVVGVEDYELTKGIDRLYNYVNYEHFKDLPVVGTNGVPYPEQILELSPQVIVMSKSATADADQLQAQTGTPVVLIPGSDAVLDEGAYETIRILGELYGMEERAQELSAYLKGIEADLAGRTEAVPAESKPTVYVGGVSFRGLHGFEGTEAGYGPFRLINAVNLADTTGQSGAFDIDLEQVLSWDPEVIFLDFSGLELIGESFEQNPDYYKALTAVQEGKLYSQISFRSYAANLDTALANTYYAASVLYPEEFSDVDPEAKAGEIFEMLLGANPYPDMKETGYEFRPIQIGE